MKMEEGSILRLTGAGNTDYLAQLILLNRGYELVLDHHHSPESVPLTSPC